MHSFLLSRVCSAPKGGASSFIRKVSQQVPRTGLCYCFNKDDVAADSVMHSVAKRTHILAILSPLHLKNIFYLYI